MSVLLLKTPGVIQPSGPRTIPGGFVWLAPVAGIPTSVGKGGRFVNPGAATTIGVAPCALSKKFTVVTVYCQKDASKAQVEAFRIGAGSTGVRWDFCTTSGGSNPDTWTLNGVVNGTNQSRNTSFNTLPRVNVASFDPASFEVTSGVLGGADLLSYSQTASMVAPSNGSVIVRGGPIQFYGIFILPYRLSRARAVELVRNPWQVFLESRPIWVGAAAGGSTTITGTIGTAVASGFTGTVNANRTIAGALGTATASGFRGVVNANRTISGALGTAVASGLAGNVNANRTISGALGTATASGFQGAVTNGNTTTITGSLGTAVATGLTGGVAWNRYIAGLLGVATASGFTGGVANGTVVTGRRRTSQRKILVTIKGARFLVPEDQLDEWLDDKEEEIVEQAVKPVTVVSKKARIVRANTLPVPKVSVNADEAWVAAAVAELNRRVQQRIADERKRLQDEDDEEVMLLLL